MARYLFVNVMYQGKFPIHYGIISMAELSKMEDETKLAAILEERHPDKIVAVDVYDSDGFVALPSNGDTYHIARQFLQTVDARQFKGKWQEGEV